MLRRSIRLLISALVLAAAVATILPFAVRGLLRHWEKNPILRGRLLAAELGCPSCHFPYRDAEIPNPGSRWGSVPRFEAGNGFMYDAGDRPAIEEYVRFGAPRGWLDDEAARRRLEAQRLRMPAYGDRLSDAEVADLVAYVAAVEGLDRPGDETAAGGRELARRWGCLSCHGIEGSGGLPNPGSLGGFIPGFLGTNFEDLVESEDEFREWVRTGSSRRLAAQPVVSWFWHRQEIVMPAFEDFDDQQLAQLWAWVRAVREAS